MTGPGLTLVVLFVSDLERSHAFYTAVGLTLHEERHGSGPTHFAASLGGNAVLELYPANGGTVTRTRLGLLVDGDLDLVVERLLDLGHPLSRERSGHRAEVTDPDGNVVELWSVVK